MDLGPLNRPPLQTRVLLTGANGLLGQALVRRLAPNGDYEGLATARDDALHAEADMAYERMDVTDPDAVPAAFESFAPDVVVNCAALSDVSACENHRNEAWATNARAVKRLARHCEAHRARLVQVSTDFVFDGEHGPYRERDRPAPVNYYGRTKHGGENNAREAGRGQWAIVRTVLLYGTGRRLSRSNFALWVLDELGAGAPLQIVDDQWRTPTFVEDLAAGIEQIIQKEASGLYHLSGPERVSVYEFACTIAEVFGYDPSLIEPVSSDDFEDAVARPPRTGFVIDKARSELGYDPRGLEAGLRTLGDQLGTPPVA
jgi:dTDP-4-dehydrorhamnose reductase